MGSTGGPVAGGTAGRWLPVVAGLTAYLLLTVALGSTFLGVKVVEYELRTPDWERRVRESKFKDYPTYGRARRGHIGLQDHGDQAAFRNIKIRDLKN